MKGINTIKDLFERGFVYADFVKGSDVRIQKGVYRRLQDEYSTKISSGINKELVLEWSKRVMRKAELHMEHACRFTLTINDFEDAINLVNRFDQGSMRIIINVEDNSDDDDNDYNSDEDDSNDDTDDDDDLYNSYCDDDSSYSDDDSDIFKDNYDNWEDIILTNNKVTTVETKCDVVVINNEVNTIEISKSLDVQIENLKAELPIKDDKIKALKELIELEELQFQARMKDEEIKKLEELLATKSDANGNNIRKRKSIMSDSVGTSKESKGNDENSDFF
jgi:hypothetical protein